jgi:deoxyribose-phosphate aldolase
LVTISQKSHCRVKIRVECGSISILYKEPALMTNLNALQTAFTHKQALKVIAGLNNFDANSVAAIVQAATAGGATFIDIAASPELVRMAKGLTDLPICASAVDAELLAAAVAAGADLVEIGNFDSFYAQGIRFEADEVIALTKATRELLPHTLLSVTVPHILELDRQVELAQTLVSLGADIIQTEGGTSSQPIHSGTLGLIEKAAPTLAAAAEISRAVSVPVLCASGISNMTAPMAIAAGASGVGVGSAINKLNDPIAMIATVRSLMEALTNSSYSVKASFKA